MRLDPREWLLRHWPIKVAALLLSVLLWLVVAARRPTTQIRPVQVELQIPRGRAFTRPVPTVTAQVSGTAQGLLELYGKPLRISKVIPDSISDSQVIVPLAPGDVRVPPDAQVSVLDVYPREIMVSLDEMTRRTVPVVSRVDIQPDSGYVVTGGVAIIPSEVEIAGPRLVVESTSSVPTVAVEIQGAREPVRRQVPLDTTATGTLRLTPSSVQVAADIGPVAQRRFTAVPVAIPNDPWAAEPAVVDLAIQGPAARLLILSPDSFTVSVAVPAEAAPGDTVSVIVDAPSGISAVPEPARVVLRRRRD